MKISTQYILFVILIHLTLLLLSFYIFKENKLIFILSEFLILGSIFIAVRLYKSLINPIQLISQGTDAIKDRDFNVKFLKSGNAEMDKLIFTYNEMVDKLREEGIKQQEQHFFLDKLIQTSPIGIIILDFDNNISSLNPKTRTLLDLGSLRLKGKPIQEVPHPLAKYFAEMKSGESKTVHLSGVETFRCQKAHFVDRGFNHHFITIEELTLEILETEKKAYGKVIRMMAHEVNNSIGAINSILQSLQYYDKQIGEEDRSDYQSALDVSIERNDHLNVFMKNFADIIRLPAPNKESYDLVQLLKGIGVLFHAKMKQQEIQLKFENTAPFFIDIDVAQFEQVLVNILQNAIESIEKNGSIEFEINKENNTLLIWDTGKGIEPTNESEIFTPFFSTKKNGQGIGLTLIREILLNHGFSFSLKTISTGKTAFKITFV